MLSRFQPPERQVCKVLDLAMWAKNISPFIFGYASITDVVNAIKIKLDSFRARTDYKQNKTNKNFDKKRCTPTASSTFHS